MKKKNLNSIFANSQRPQWRRPLLPLPDQLCYPASHSTQPTLPPSCPALLCPPYPYPSAMQFRRQMKCSSVHGILIFAANLTNLRAIFPLPLSLSLCPTLQLSLSSCRSLANQFNVRHFAAKWEIFEISSKIRCVPRIRIPYRAGATICCSGELAALRYFLLQGRASEEGGGRLLGGYVSHLSETHLNVNFRRVACP